MGPMIPSAAAWRQGSGPDEPRAEGLQKGLGSLRDAEEVYTRRGSSGRGKRSWGGGLLGDSSPGTASAPSRSGVLGADPALSARGGTYWKGRDAVVGGAPGCPWEGRSVADTRHRSREGRGRRCGSSYLPAASPAPPASFSVSKL